MKNCTECQGTGFIVIDTGNTTAAKECVCRRLSRSRSSPGTPLTEEAASTAANMLCETLAFAPKSDLGRVVITNALMKMCHTQEEAFWLIERAANLHARWDTCGIAGLRQILCSRYTPKDGVVISSTSTYPAGIPSEQGIPESEDIASSVRSVDQRGSGAESPVLKFAPTDCNLNAALRPPVPDLKPSRHKM